MFKNIFAQLLSLKASLIITCTFAAFAAQAQLAASSTSTTLTTGSSVSTSVSSTVTATATLSIQPRTDTFSVFAGQSTNVNTAANDTMPAGSGWFLVSSNCTPAPTMSSNGMLAVTGPSPAGSICNAIYKACKGGANLPLPNPDCGTAMVVISSPAISSTMTSTISFAVNTDTVTVTPGTQSNYFVLQNDTVPLGAVVSLASGSTCAGAAVSNSGMASYTAPNTAGTSCTVVYQVCVAVVTSPAPLCRTATLIVTAQTSTPNTVTLSLKTDTATITAGVTGQINVMLNDTYPTGSTSTLGIGSTCAGASINSIGVVTYTGPAAGTTCTVVYKVCTPATLVVASQCQTSTLVVTGTPARPPTAPDTNSTAAGMPAIFNVAANDKPPAGTTYFLQTSTCASTAISPAGMVSYTAPATAPGSCTIIYLACPAGITPPSAFCSAEKFVVTSR